MSQYGYPQQNIMQQAAQYSQNNYYPSQGPGQGQGQGQGQPSYPPQQQYQQQQPQQQPPNQMYNQPPQQQQQYQQPPPPQQYNQNQNQNQYSQQNHQNHPLAAPTNPPSNQSTQSQPQSHTTTRGPYIDPETNIVYPCNNPAFEGWLTKQSMWLKDWRRRYFLLCGSKLFFAKNSYAAPHGMIDLSTATTVKSADVKSRKKNSFEVSTHDMTYLMYTDSEKEKDDWIGSVGRSIVRSSGTFLTKNDVAGAGTATGSGGNGGGNDYGDNDYGYGDEDDDGVFENSENHPYFND